MNSSTNPNEQEAVAEWMRSLGYEPWVYQGDEVTLWKPSNNANIPDVTGEQAAFFYHTIASERKSWKALTAAERAELESYRRQRATALEDYHEFGKAPVGSPERLTAYISYLSPHNLRSGAEALRDWRKSWAQQAVEEVEAREASIRIDELNNIPHRLLHNHEVFAYKKDRLAILSIGEGGKS